MGGGPASTMVTCGLAMQDETDKIEIDQADEPRGVARRTVLRLGAVGVTAATVVIARSLWMPSLACCLLMVPSQLPPSPSGTTSSIQSDARAPE